MDFTFTERGICGEKGVRAHVTIGMLDVLGCGMGLPLPLALTKIDIPVISVM
jgi:hypothetical protein